MKYLYAKPSKLYNFHLKLPIPNAFFFQIDQADTFAKFIAAIEDPVIDTLMTLGGFFGEPLTIDRKPVLIAKLVDYLVYGRMEPFYLFTVS